MYRKIKPARSRWRSPVEGRLPRGIGVERLHDPPIEWGRQFEALGLSQKQLGQLAGLHRTFVGSVERGESNISIYNIGRLADALGVEPMELFKLDRT